MTRAIALAYGVASYAIFLGTFLYAIGFLGNFGVPKTLDGPPTMPTTMALAVDLGLLTLFALQHSIMARKGFKQALTRVVPEGAERSTYVLASSAALLLLFWMWQPLGGTIWDVQHPLGRATLWAGFGFGWMLVLVTTFVINHFDLFGLRQSWAHFRGRTPQPLGFKTPLLYRIVRHPLYVGWFFAFWSTPTMTVTHLLFAAVTTAYILVAIRFEERDLMQAHPEYAQYRQRVPMLVPSMARRATPAQMTRTIGRASACVLAVLLPAQATWAASAGRAIDVPMVPTNLAVPAQMRPFSMSHAEGTQNDPAFVAPGAIPWLLVSVVGAQEATHGRGMLAQAAFIQRVNTSGGMAPSTGCASPTDIGTMVLVPYTADYVFYRPAR